MSRVCDTCPFHLAFEAEMRNFAQNVTELKDRVRRLESTLARGVLLLVANLVGVVSVLVGQMAQG